VIEANTLGNSSGVDLGYRRAFGRHVTLGALLEWAYPNPGYWLLQGFAHTLETAVWIKRPWTGVYFAANVTVGHQFLITLPELRTIAVGAGAAIGWSWDLTEHINVGFALGLRRMGVVERSTQICTVHDQCVFTADGFQPRFSLTFAWRW